MSGWVSAPQSSGMYEMTIGGRFRRIGASRELRPVLRKNGYLYVEFSFGVIAGLRIKKQLLVHRLLAEAFIPMDDSRPHVNHKDGIKTNNAIENLEWCSQGENNAHAHAAGLARSQNTGPGSGSPRAILNVTDVKHIRELALMGHKLKDLATIYRVSPSTIACVVNRKTWYHV